MLAGFRRSLIADPIKALANDFDRLVVGCFAALLLRRMHFYYFYLSNLS